MILFKDFLRLFTHSTFLQLGIVTFRNGAFEHLRTFHTYTEINISSITDSFPPLYSIANYGKLCDYFNLSYDELMNLYVVSVGISEGGYLDVIIMI